MEYHVVAAGTCWAAIPGGPSVQLGAGDVVMFPHGDAHVVSSAPGMRGQVDLDWFAQVADERWPVQVTYDGLDVTRAPPPEDGADTTIVCGFIGCDLQPFNPLIEALPRMLHLRSGSEDAWIGSSRSRRSSNRARSGRAARRCSRA
jgi:hypothetical protein